VVSTSDYQVSGPGFNLRRGQGPYAFNFAFTTYWCTIFLQQPGIMKIPSSKLDLVRYTHFFFFKIFIYFFLLLWKQDRLQVTCGQIFTKNDLKLRNVSFVLKQSVKKESHVVEQCVVFLKVLFVSANS
jgi:hypothetical protein